MEKENYSQLELFSPTKGYAQIRTAGTQRASFFRYIKNYERVILIIIGFVITGVVSFSLGVEKGKKIAAAQINSNLDIALKVQRPIESKTPSYSLVSAKQYQAGIKKEVSKLPLREKQTVTLQPKTEQYRQNYTIQIATYSNRNYAEKEVQMLKKRGLAPRILTKSEFLVLCVGNFPNKDSARSMLSELKKQYRGSILRRL